jgi:hypothetical protein
MTTPQTYIPKMDDPEAGLEKALIESYLQTKGVDSERLHFLPEGEAKRLLTEASVFAATKLAEVEARAQFVHEIHGGE